MPTEECDIPGRYQITDDLVNDRRLATSLLSVKQVSAAMQKTERLVSLVQSPESIDFAQYL